MTKTAWIVLIVAILLVVVFVGASWLVPDLTGTTGVGRWGFMGPGWHLHLRCAPAQVQVWADGDGR